MYYNKVYDTTLRDHHRGETTCPFYIELDVSLTVCAYACIIIDRLKF